MSKENLLGRLFTDRVRNKSRSSYPKFDLWHVEGAINRVIVLAWYVLLDATLYLASISFVWGLGAVKPALK